MVFGPESKNPREKRAYADTMIAKAKRTDKPEDKVAALQASARSLHTKKGQSLGERAVETIVKKHNDDRPDLEIFHVRKRTADQLAINGVGYSWIDGKFVEAYEAVEGALGPDEGLKISKPTSAAEYHEAASKLVSGRSGLLSSRAGSSAEALASHGQSSDASFVETDQRRPKSHYMGSVVQAVVAQPHHRV